MIITVGGTKGGIGKTTLALQVAIALARSGRKVWLVDGDAQGSAIGAITARSEAGRSPGLSAGHFSNGATLRAQVQQQRGQFDDVVIDVGGRDSSAFRAALVLTDAIVVPFAPRNFDVWALEETAALIEEARAQRDGLRAYAVMNRADTNAQSADNAEAEQAVRDMTTFTLLPVRIHNRKAFAVASEGLHVDEVTGSKHDAKASAEIAALIDALTHA